MTAELGPVALLSGVAVTRRRSVLLLVAVVVLGLLGTSLSVAALQRGDAIRAAQELSAQVESVSQTVTAEVRQYGNALRDMAAAASAQPELDVVEFAAATTPIDRSRLPGATGISLIIAATTAQIPRVQAAWRARGATGLRLQPAPGFTSHLCTVFVRTLDGTAPSTGRDLSPAPAAVEALNLARDTRRLAASQPYLFLRDAALPRSQQQLSTILAAPLFATSPKAADLGRFRGWAVLGVRGDDFLRQSIGVVARDTVSVIVRDTTRDGRQSELASWRPADATANPSMSRKVTVDAPQRRWQLQVTATDQLLPDPAVPLQTTAWLIGALLTILLLVLTATVTTSRDRALRSVAEATAALHEDIARREQIEEQLRRREQELVSFAGVIAHDLRGPLAWISGYADFLREEATPGMHAEHQHYLERLRGGAYQMETLLDDLLSYATADNRPLTRQPVNLDDLVADIVTERTTGRTDHPPTLIVGPLPTISGDPTLLRQVFDNLIGNAIKYTHHGRPPHVEITADYEPAAGRWRIEVCDHGIGIAPEQRDAIFTAFTRAHGSERYPGTGLGLAIVHRIVERHDGRIGVTGNEHGGSLFWITLPDTTTSDPQADGCLASSGSDTTP